MLTSKRYISRFLVVFALALVMMISVSSFADPYALFWSTEGPTAKVYCNERLSKHLLSYRYIPENFDSLLAGPSVSANMRTARFRSLTAYNLSLDGANLCELKRLIDIVSARRHLEALVLCLHPVLLRTHLPKTNFLEPHQYWTAYGSLDLLKACWVRYRTGDAIGQFDPWGRSDFNRFAPRSKPASEYIDTAARLDRLGLQQYWNCDPVALEGLGSIVAAHRASGSRLLIVYPPMPARLYALHKSNRMNFLKRVSEVLDGVEVFDASHLAEFASESRFVDDEHLSDEASDELLDLIEKRLSRSSANR